MTSNHNDLNHQRTVKDIEDAFLALYSGGGMRKVSISELCKNCSLSRSTFYLYFEDKYAVLQSVEKRLLVALWKINANLPDAPKTSKITECALQTIAHIRENMAWYRSLLGNYGDPMFIYRWKKDIQESLYRKLIRRNVSQMDIDIYGSVFAASLVALYTFVLFHCPDISDETLSGYMNDILAMTLS